MSEAEDILFQTFRGNYAYPGGLTHLKIEGSEQSHYWLWTWDDHRTMMIGFTPEEFDALIKTLAVDRIQQAWELGRDAGYQQCAAESRSLDQNDPVNPYRKESHDLG